jgi:DNA sulfur modification protein DndD
VILQRLTLADFRQFRGEHQVEFAHDPIKNVTVITGVNGAGKTALFYALNWVLYGEASALPGVLINKAALAEPSPRAWAQLQFMHEGSEYAARRDLVRTPAGAEREDSFLLQRLEAGGRVQRVPDPDARVNVILPRDARRYFFFDGERIDEMSRPGHEREVQDAVRSVLKLKALERAAEHLQDVAREYSRRLKEQGGLDQEEMRLIERMEVYGDRIKEGETQLAVTRESVEILARQLEQTRAKLDQLSEVKDLQRQERELEQRHSRLETEQRELADSLQRAVNEGASAIAIGAVRRAREVVEAKRERGEIPSGIQQQLVDDLLRDGVCICGRVLDSGAREALVTRRQVASAKEVVDAVLRAAAELRGLEVRAETARHSVERVIARRLAVSEELTDIQRELEALAARRSSEFSEQVAELEQTRAMLDQRYRQALLDQGRISADVDRDQRQLEISRNKLTQLQGRSASGQLAKRRFELAEAAAEAARQLLATFSSDMRRQIQDATDEIFKSFVWKEKQFETVRVTEDYRLEVEDRFHTASLAGLSAGERQVLSLSFITGMSRVTGEEAPLVIDTPFGRLSEMPVGSIVRSLPTIAKQLILFVTDRELDPESRRLLEPRVGRAYDLAFDDETGSTTLRRIA